MILALVSVTSCRRDGAKAPASAQAGIVGAWQLAALEEPGADGTIHPADCTGALVFTSDGRMSVQVMYRDAHSKTSTGSTQYAQGGYEASFGRYEVDERTRSFTYRVEGALVRSLIGKDLKRIYELDDRQLVVTPSNPNEHWRVTWRRY